MTSTALLARGVGDSGGPAPARNDMIRIGPLSIDPVEYGSRGTGILGIRDSGKTYTATLLAERLFEAGVPFIAFDPIGVWRFLRVPGKGRGYPVVVAGGQDGDLPLWPASAPSIVEAAMVNGISLVIDLFSMELSKADWRAIVRDSVKLLLHRNQQHGLRHVFLEEAAEFIPQKVTDGLVYAEVEKLARMGGNSRLGYTLINQRAEEVNKAVLELCDNLFLHRQKGRNSLVALGKWLDVGAVKDSKAIIDTLATLPTGECWAWMGGTDRPVHVKVPAKNSLHPDRRVMRGADPAVKRQAVDVAAFVGQLRDSLPKLEEQARANDPKHLRAEMARLQAELRKAQAGGGASAAEVEAARREGHQEGRRAVLDELLNKAGLRVLAGEIYETAATLDSTLKEFFEAAASASMSRPKVVKVEIAPRQNAPRPAAPKSSTPAAGLTGPQQRILDALAELEAIGARNPSRIFVANLAGYGNITSTGFAKAIGALKTAGHVEYPVEGTIGLTPSGAALAAPAERPLSSEALQQRVMAFLSGPGQKMLAALIAVYPNDMSREDLMHVAGYSNATSTGFVKAVGRLRALGFANNTTPGRVAADATLFVE